MTDSATNPTFNLEYDAFEHLVLVDAAGERHVGVEPTRAFPITAPDQWIVICDANGRELICLQDLEPLPEPLRQMLKDELRKRDFIPHILRINSATGNNPSQWDVQTDRGPKTFLLKSDDDLRRLGSKRALLIDAYGIRYLIPDTRKLDGFSRRMLERYL
jgi:hypothetical protein